VTRKKEERSSHGVDEDIHKKKIKQDEPSFIRG